MDLGAPTPTFRPKFLFTDYETSVWFLTHEAGLLGECNKAFHRNGQEHCLAHKCLLVYYLSVYLLFKVLSMSYRTLHCPAPVASWTDQQPHCHLPFPDHVHTREHPSQSLALQSFLVASFRIGLKYYFFKCLPWTSYGIPFHLPWETTSSSWSPFPASYFSS